MKAKLFNQIPDALFPSLDDVLDPTTDTNNEFDLEDDEDQYHEVVIFWTKQSVAFIPSSLKKANPNPHSFRRDHERE